MNTLSLLSFAPLPRRTAPRFMKALQVIAERRALGQLDDTRLADIGITRAEAKREASRPFWDLPKR
ncbi:MAG: DUF1127 domain-containing protein [Pseudomonadota bacterium]